MSEAYVRKELYDSLWLSLTGKPRLIQVVIGPRQVGKTTLALQVLKHWKGPKIYETADQPQTPTAEWVVQRWLKIRKLLKSNQKDGLLILDEVQKIPRWSEVVKKLADEDRNNKTKLRVLLLGSSALLVQRGLTESLAGRFELHRHAQWSFKECRDCFHLGLQDYFLFGGYPGALALRGDPVRWARYIRDTLIETVIGKDVLLMSPVQKPALLRQTFAMACAHPAEILSYQSMIGQLTDAGNTVTIAHYFNLLSAAFLIAPLPRWSGSRLRQRGSSPKVIVRDNSLVNALTFPAMKKLDMTPTWKGRLIENSVGAALTVLAEKEGCELFYWRDRSDEVDFVVRHGMKLIAVEVKSGRSSAYLTGMNAFLRRYPDSESVLISDSKSSLSIRQHSIIDFFSDPKIILEK